MFGIRRKADHVRLRDGAAATDDGAPGRKLLKVQAAGTGWM